MVDVTEADRRPLQPAEAFHIHAVRTIDQNVCDRGIGQQRRQGTHPDGLVRQFLREANPFRVIQRHIRFGSPRREILHRRRHILSIGIQQIALANLFEQPILQCRLDGDVVGSSCSPVVSRFFFTRDGRLASGDRLETTGRIG
jgi:hypothetical protein